MRIDCRGNLCAIGRTAACKIEYWRLTVRKVPAAELERPARRPAAPVDIHLGAGGAMSDLDAPIDSKPSVSHFLISEDHGANVRIWVGANTAPAVDYIVRRGARALADSDGSCLCAAPAWSNATRLRERYQCIGIAMTRNRALEGAVYEGVCCGRKRGCANHQRCDKGYCQFPVHFISPSAHEPCCSLAKRFGPGRRNVTVMPFTDARSHSRPPRSRPRDGACERTEINSMYWDAIELPMLARQIPRDHQSRRKSTSASRFDIASL